MRPRTIFLVLLSACLCTCVARAETTIKAEVDKTEITTDELLTYKLSVASTEKTLPSPKLPSFDGFAVVSQAQSSTVSYQKSGMQSILVFAFILLPKQAGIVTIGPAQITVSGKAYTSESQRIMVKQGVSRAQPRLKNPAPDRRSTPSGEEPFPEDLSSSRPRYNL